MTEEERKDKKRAQDRAYRAKYPERAKGYNKSSYTNNKEKRTAYNKQHKLDNPDMYRDYNNQYRAERTLNYWVVYCLPNNVIPYCGQTTRPQFRMNEHNLILGRCTDDWFILDICATKQEALSVEASYHAMGYDGINESWFTK